MHGNKNKFQIVVSRTVRRRIFIAVTVVLLLLPWAMSLICMKAGGRADWMTERDKSQSGEENGSMPEVPSEESGKVPQGDVSGEISEMLPGESAGKSLENSSEMEKNLENGELKNEDGKQERPEDRKILVERNGVKTYLTLESYLPGIVICQINPFCEMETLKCQAVIARTYLCRVMGEKTEIPEDQLEVKCLENWNGNDGLKTEKTTGEARGKQVQREELAKGLERCRQAVEETEGIVMTFEDQEILPMFHEMSAGRTRRAGEEYPYLCPVQSRWDKEEENWQSTYQWSEQEFASKISHMDDEILLSPGELAKKLQIVKRDESGYVEWVQIGNRTYEGEKVREVLGLPSASFSLGTAEKIKSSEKEEKQEAGAQIQAIVCGRGHGYGLSQAGADHMAKEGWDYEEILGYYYTDIQLTSRK